MLYQHTNTVNGKRYIGYSKEPLRERLKGHVKSARRGSKYHFHCAIRKYGIEVFVSEALSYEETEEGAKDAEILYILDRQPEYNMTMGGDGTSGRKFKNPNVANSNRQRDWTVCQNGMKGRTGDKHPNYGKPGPMRGKAHSGTTRVQQSASAKARSPESRLPQKEAVILWAKTDGGLTHLKSAGKKGAEVRWARERARKAALAQETSSSE